MFSARNISKKFGTLQVLKGIDLQLAPGAVTSIVGPSGAGKTTLLQIIGTLSRPDSGELLYDQCNIFALSDNELSRFRNRNIGFVFQMHRLLPEFSLQENVAMPALIAGQSKSEAMARAHKLLEMLGLGNRLNHKPSQLSGGECQRGAVARALVNNPQVVLADEPSGSLDSANRAELRRLFLELRDSLGATFLIVTHDESLASDSDIVISMADGRIVDTVDNRITT